MQPLEAHIHVTLISCFVKSGTFGIPRCVASPANYTNVILRHVYSRVCAFRVNACKYIKSLRLTGRSTCFASSELEDQTLHVFRDVHVFVAYQSYTWRAYGRAQGRRLTAYAH